MFLFLEVLSISRNDFHCNSSDSFFASLSSTKISHLSFFESGLNGTMDALCSLEKLGKNIDNGIYTFDGFQYSTNTVNCTCTTY